MKNQLLFKLIFTITSFFMICSSTIYYSKNGAIVEIKEKYGVIKIDTITQIELSNDQYILYGMFDEIKGWYPKENHSITILKELKN